ncbi:hypothetical protein [Halorubrum trapanicum]|uniref:hypothetical protein n=1 Tax=Halorubrum trapanicum TaxID=29284 RepID=UPI000BBB1C24|nr:hypothetical protein [Halorubrum trapanicum]
MSRDTDHGGTLVAVVVFVCFLAGLASVISAMATFLLNPFGIADAFPSLLVVPDPIGAVQRGSVGVGLILLAEVVDALTGPEYVVTDAGLDDGVMMSTAVQSGLILLLSGISLYFSLTGLLLLPSTVSLLLEFAVVDALVSVVEAGLWVGVGLLFLGLVMWLAREKQAEGTQPPEPTGAGTRQERGDGSRADAHDDGPDSTGVENASRTGTVQTSSTVERDDA